MHTVHILSHAFIKQNNLTITKGRKFYDVYKCSYCGLEGKRFGLTNEISVTRNKVSCTYYKNYLKKQKELEEVEAAQKQAATKIKVIDSYTCQMFGFEFNNVYDRVECPDSEKDNFLDDIWIFSQKRKEPVRLLPGEFEIVL